MATAANAANLDGCVHRTAHHPSGCGNRYCQLPPDLKRVITAYKNWPATALSAELTDSIYNLDLLLDNHNGKCPPPERKRAFTLSTEEFKEAMRDPDCLKLYKHRRLLREHWNQRVNGRFGFRDTGVFHETREQRLKNRLAREWLGEYQGPVEVAGQFMGL